MPAQLTGASRVVPIIGDPVKYLESPVRLTAEFAQRGERVVVIPMQVAADGLEVTLAALAATKNVDGMLVTMPHKLTTFPYCATTSRRSQFLQVVSHLRRNSDGTWHGEMFDGLMFVTAQQNNGAVIEGRRALLLGAGGAGSAIAFELLEQGVGQLAIHDRDPGRVDALVARLSGIGAGAVRAASADPTGFDLVFNATPMGMDPDDPLPVDTSLLTASMFVGDVVAGHGVTQLIMDAREAGCGTATGDDMVSVGLTHGADYLLGGFRNAS